MIKTLPFKTLLLALMSVFSFGIMSTQAAAIVFGDLDLENGVQYADPFDGGDFTVTFGGGGNNGKYYTTGSGIRVYGDGTMAVAAKSGNVTSVTITFDGSNKPTTADVVNCGTYDPETGVWTGKFSSVTFTRPSGSGHWRIKSVDATVEAGTPIDPDGGTDPGVDPQDYATVTLPYEESFISSQGQFVTENNAQGGLDAVWKTSQYGMTANGYGCTSAIMNACLVSPYIDATGTSTLTMTFDENLRYFGGENQAEQEAMVEVREKGGNWQRIEVPTRVLANNNNFTNVGVIDLSQYAGKVFQIQFNYWADTSAPGRWEIKNLSIQAGEVVVKQDAELSFAESNWTVTIGESNTFPELVNPNNLPVTWSSSKTDIATIDEATGAIELLAAGQTTIKASFAGDDSFNEGSASYQLVVKEQEIPGTDKYVLVTDASTLTDGDKIILVGVTDDGAYAMSTTQNPNNRAANAVTIEDDGTIIPSSAIQKITLEEGFYFNVGNGYLYAAGGEKSNYMKTEAEPDADGNAQASIDIDPQTGDAAIVFQGTSTRNYMRFNPNSGNPVFSCYAETSSIKTLPRIYRFYDGEIIVKQDAELSFGESTFTAVIGETTEFPELVNPNNLPVTWSSSKTDVATIDEATGAIELLAAGQTIINASFAGNDYFNEGSASYQLVVEEQEIPGTDKYVLVTDASTLAAGDKIILVGVTDDGAYAMSTTQNSNNRAANAVTIEDNGCIIPSSTIQKITLEEGFYFNVGNGYLYAAGGEKSNYLRTEAEPDADGNALASIDIDAETGDATIVFQGTSTRNNMRFNPNSGNPMFSCYAETSSVKTLPRIYRFYDGEIIVKQDVATIVEVEPTSVACDETGLFTPVITPADGATFTQKWSSDNEEVLTVLQNGMYLALAEGTANVTLTLVPDDTEHFNQVSTTFAVTVVKVYQTIAEFIEANTTGQLSVDGAQVLYVDPAMKNIYIADASAAICLFNNAGFETYFSAGDILGGTLTGKYSPYKNLPEITNVDLSNVITTDKKDVVPVIIDATADDMAANLCRVVKMEKAEVTEEAGKYYVGDIQVYDNFKLNYEIAEGTYDILGIAIIFNSTYEICPIEAPTKVSDVPVGISALALQPSDIIFDLQGRRVLQPTKGMYIVNGKKVVIR
ncbi:MAG: Ig-like domain-containing protein [Prevotella sp.]|nr:Ig-like domain-containing protein [Prevotella sp.]